VALVLSVCSVSRGGRARRAQRGPAGPPPSHQVSYRICAERGGWDHRPVPRV